jgi:hypothetical protein
VDVKRSGHFCFDYSSFEPQLGACHVTINLFETIETFGAAMAIQVNEVLVAYGFNTKILAYVKDEGNNLSIMTTALTFIVSYQELRLTTPLIRSYWGHAMSS